MKIKTKPKKPVRKTGAEYYLGELYIDREIKIDNIYIYARDHVKEFLGQRKQSIDDYRNLVLRQEGDWDDPNDWCIYGTRDETRQTKSIKLDLIDIRRD